MNADPAPTAFAPPPTPGFARSLILAIGAHALLLAALAMGVQWQRGSTPVTLEAELWSELAADAIFPPTTQTAPQPALASAPLVVNDGGTTTAAAPGVTIDVFQEVAEQQKEKQLQDSQMEQEKRRREALKEKPPQIEKETNDETEAIRQSLRDPT